MLKRKYTSETVLLILISFSIIFYTDCGNRIERVSSSPDSFDYVKWKYDNTYLKLHLSNGDVYVLENWEFNKGTNSVSGSGMLLDYNRKIKDTAEFTILLEDVVLAETNEISNASGSFLLTAATIVTGIFTIVCLSNPKACFGSCPTFYAGDGNQLIVQAEGFSSSISPALEEEDIDALFRVKPDGKNFEIQLKNEAYETHVIRKADILALHKEKNNRVFAAPEGKFFEVENLSEASNITAKEGDISEQLCRFDGLERFSEADSLNLAEKEIIEISFNVTRNTQKGLVIASRQTLMTTFLFYQSLAYMGSSAGYFLADLERNSSEAKKIIDNPRRELGSIEVFIENETGIWEKMGETGEHGPISTDVKIIPLKIRNNNSDLKLRLRMTKGLWRIDYLALADIIKEVEPIVIHPSTSFPKLTKENQDVVKLLNNADSVLITFPGDSYFLNYTLPDDYENYELFMASKGYYLEWMRQEWLEEENPLKVYQLFFNPKQFFKDLAPQFKEVEAEMEETFWSSKYVYP